jgi:hypothetical protein
MYAGELRWGEYEYTKTCTRIYNRFARVLPVLGNLLRPRTEHPSVSLTT